MTQMTKQFLRFGNTYIQQSSIVAMNVRRYVKKDNSCAEEIPKLELSFYTGSRPINSIEFQPFDVVENALHWHLCKKKPFEYLEDFYRVQAKPNMLRIFRELQGMREATFNYSVGDEDIPSPKDLRMLGLSFADNTSGDIFQLTISQDILKEGDDE